MVSDGLEIKDGVTIDESLLSWKAVRSAGPGGQNVNKVATKVELRFALSACEQLTDVVRARLRRSLPSHAVKGGTVIITEQGTRSQSQNLERARQRLAQLIREAMVKPKRRVATKPSRAAKRRRLESKRRRSNLKKARGPVSRDD